MEYYLINHVVEEQCIEDIINVLEEYLTENINEFGEYSYLVDNPDEIELISSDIRFVSVSKTDYNQFYLKVKVETIAFTAMKLSSGELESDEIKPSFIIGIVATLDDRNFDFSIENVEVGDEINWDKNNAYSPYMVPYIYVEDMDSMAEKFLEKYYPEALNDMVPVDPFTVAKRMNLKLKEVRITKTGTIFGQIFFEDSAVTFFNPQTKEFIKEYLDAGTIMYDPEIFFMRSLGSINNTIIHECLHWYLHQPFIALQNLFINKKNISCSVEESKKRDKDKDPYEWLEWQCSHLAPRILMPKKWVTSFIEGKYEEYGYKEGNVDNPSIVLKVIEDLAIHFNVSKLSAKIRMLDLGYKEAEGVLNYVDDRYLDNFDSKSLDFRRGETFIISDTAALKLYESNITLRRLIDERKLIYLENKICINSPKYIATNEDEMWLTEYARNHPEECCISIVQRTEQNRKVGIHYYQKTILFSSAIVNEMVYADADLGSEHNQKILKEMDNTFDTMEEIANILENLPMTFHESLVAHMKRKRCTVLDLVGRAHVFKQKITDMRNEPNKRWDLEDVLAVCIGLNLHPEFIFDMLDKANLSLNHNTKENIFYRGMINQHYKASVDVWNEKLKERGYPLLGTRK
jgi:hypothetical protein